MRQDVVSDMARRLGVVVSKRIGLAVGLWGEPGIGKTHAAQEILERVPCHHLTLRATLGEAQIAAALPHAKTLPAWVIAQLGRLERGEYVEKATFSATINAALTAVAPFVLHLEDLHEVSPERLELIVALAQAIGHTRGVGLLVTSRAELPAPFHNHRLEPLTLQETADLLERELQSAVPQDGLGWIYQRTWGNPLFTLEFLRYLIRHGFLWSDGHDWHWRAPPDGFVPVTVEALIAQFAASLILSPEACTALGARVSLPSGLDAKRLETIWAVVADLSREALARAATELERCGALDARHSAHPLVAETLQQELPNSQRVQFARRALDALEPLDPAFAAEYVSAAELDPLQASERFERLSARFYQGGDFGRAARVLARAVEHASGERHGRLALEAARLSLAHDVPESERLARLAMQDTARRTDATFLCATAMQSAGRHEAARQLLESLLEELPDVEKRGPTWWQQRVQFHAAAGENAEAVRVWDERTDFQAQASLWTQYRAISCLIHLSQTARAHSLIEATLLRTDLTTRDRARTLERRTMLLLREAQYEAGERNLNEILELIGHEAFASDRVAYLSNRALVRIRLGKYLEAREDMERACQLSLSTGVLTHLIATPTVLAEVQIHLSEFEAAEVTLLEATALAQRHSHFRLFDCYGRLSLLYLRWNPPHGPTLARRYAQLSLEVARPLERADALVATLEVCVRAELNSHAPQTALVYARELERVAVHTGLKEDATISSALMGRALAALGEREAALPYLQRAKELYEAQGNPNESVAHALEIDRLDNDIEAARLKLAWFHQHGDSHHAARALAYFPQLEAAPPVTAAPPAARLNVLGPVTLTRDGQPIPTRARKRLEILSYLLETRIAGRAQASTLELVDALYEDMPETEAKRALKQLVYLNRSSLGADCIVSTPTGYALHAVSSDAEDFLRTKASDLWRGAYLGDLTEGWHPGVRDAMTLALQTKIETLLASDPSEAARLGSILLQMEPFDAKVLRLVVDGFERAGDPRNAHHVYRDGCARLLEVGEVLPEGMDRFLRLQAAD